MAKELPAHTPAFWSIFSEDSIHHQTLVAFCSQTAVGAHTPSLKEAALPRGHAAGTPQAAQRGWAGPGRVAHPGAPPGTDPALLAPTAPRPRRPPAPGCRAASGGCVRGRRGRGSPSPAGSSLCPGTAASWAQRSGAGLPVRGSPARLGPRGPGVEGGMERCREGRGARPAARWFPGEPRRGSALPEGGHGAPPPAAACRRLPARCPPPAPPGSAATEPPATARPSHLRAAAPPRPPARSAIGRAAAGGGPVAAGSRGEPGAAGRPPASRPGSDARGTGRRRRGPTRPARCPGLPGRHL